MFFCEFYRKSLIKHSRNYCRVEKFSRDGFRKGLQYENRRAFIPDVATQVIESSQIKETNDWKNVVQGILENSYNRGQFTSKNIDAVIVGCCTSLKRYELGASYLEYLQQQNVTPNLATLGKYLRLLYFQYDDHGKSNKDEILKIYNSLRANYPVLDSFTLENAIMGLSVTPEWRKCVDLLKEMKISTVPSGMSYSATISAAFLNGDENLAWDLLNETIENDRIPKDTTYLSYIKTLNVVKNAKKMTEKLEKLFHFFQQNDIKCSEEVAYEITATTKKLNYNSHLITVPFKGTCKSCSQTLKNFELSDEEFTNLKRKVFDNVIVGKDIFTKTNPEEVERFKDFVRGMKKFDVVLDGLNVAYSAGTKQSPQVFATLVASVVSHFVQQKMSVLVLGRVHMRRWPKFTWEYVTKNATVFLTQNISQDDPYLLYCALNSGKDTIIVTRDLMRGHKFLLKHPREKILFARWLNQRQYQLIRVDNNKGPVFKKPAPFTSIAQKNQNVWHIPYEKDPQQDDKNDFHKNWLCLKLPQ